MGFCIVSDSVFLKNERHIYVVRILLILQLVECRPQKSYTKPLLVFYSQNGIVTIVTTTFIGVHCID